MPWPAGSPGRARLQRRRRIAAVETSGRPNGTAAVFQMAEAKSKPSRRRRKRRRGLRGLRLGRGRRGGYRRCRRGRGRHGGRQQAAGGLKNIQVATSAGTMRGSMYAASGTAGILEEPDPIRAMERVSCQGSRRFRRPCEICLPDHRRGRAR